MLIHQLKIHFSQYSSFFLITQQKKKSKSKKVNNHYVATQTSSALQITQQKGFSWAPVKVWQDRWPGHISKVWQDRWPWHISKRAATCLSCSECQRILCFYSTLPPESASIGGSGDLADGKPLSQENSSLGNVTLKDEVPFFVLFVFDIPSNESVLHTGKGQIGLEKVQSQ